MTMLSVSRPGLVVPSLAFVGIYATIYLVWFILIGHNAWTPAFPSARTRVILLMFSTPLWALAMLIRHLCYKNEPAVHSHLLPRSHYRSVITSKAPERGGSFRRSTISVIYLSIALCGLQLWWTSAYEKDFVYLRDVQVAMQNLSADGYSRNGA